MKRLSLILFALAVFGPLAEAQEVYSISASATQVGNLTNIVVTNNARTCLRVNAVGGESCTQAQACTAIGNPSNCSTTASVARNLNVRIYPLTLAGREEYVTFVFAAPQFTNALSDPTSFEYERMCLNWQVFNTTQRNALCTAAGRPTGCRLCQ
jgi:hypothetical protein